MEAIFLPYVYVCIWMVRSVRNNKNKKKNEKNTNKLSMRTSDSKNRYTYIKYVGKVVYLSYGLFRKKKIKKKLSTKCTIIQLICIINRLDGRLLYERHFNNTFSHAGMCVFEYLRKLFFQHQLQTICMYVCVMCVCVCVNFCFSFSICFAFLRLKIEKL